MGSSSTAPRQKSISPGYRPRRVPPNMARVRELSKEIADLHAQHPRFLTAAQARVILDTIAALHRRQRHLERRVATALNRLNNLAWRTRWTSRIVQARDLHELLGWLLARKGCDGRSVHASAMAKTS